MVSHWACISSFSSDGEEDYVIFYIWPGNTKQQGYSIYNKPLDWIHKTLLSVEGTDYKMHVSYNIKLSHFNKYITGFSFSDNQLIKSLHTVENFRKSGKWNHTDWDIFEQLLDQHFQADFDWRAKMNWESNFKNSERSYFTLSLGFEVSAYIPYQVFRDLDKTESDVLKISEFINDIVSAFKNIL